MAANIQQLDGIMWKVSVFKIFEKFQKNGQKNATKKSVKEKNAPNTLSLPYTMFWPKRPCCCSISGFKTAIWGLLEGVSEQNLFFAKISQKMS